MLLPNIFRWTLSEKFSRLDRIEPHLGGSNLTQLTRIHAIKTVLECLKLSGASGKKWASNAGIIKRDIITRKLQV